MQNQMLFDNAEPQAQLEGTLRAVACTLWLGLVGC